MRARREFNLLVVHGDGRRIARLSLSRWLILTVLTFVVALPISYAVFCLKKKITGESECTRLTVHTHLTRRPLGPTGVEPQISWPSPELTHLPQTPVH